MEAKNKISNYEYRMKGKHFQCKLKIKELEYDEEWEVYRQNWPNFNSRELSLSLKSLELESLKLLEELNGLLSLESLKLKLLSLLESLSLEEKKKLNLHETNNIGCNNCVKLWIKDEKEEAERLKKERLEKEKLEKERLEKERLEKERLEKERLEKERIINNYYILEKENIDMKNEIKILKIKVSSLENENRQFSNKRIKFIKDFELIKEELENNFKCFNNKVISELNEFNELINKYEIINERIIEKPYILHDDLFIGTEKEKKEAEIFNCPICLNIVSQPETCFECDTIFCGPCINKHIQSFTDCPYCKIKPMTLLRLGRHLKNLLESKTFSCPLNCKVIFKYSDLENHKKICKSIKEISKCNLCEKIIPNQINLKENHKHECEKLKTACTFCHQIVYKFDYKQHLETCNEAIFFCEDCKMKIPRKLNKLHSDYFCKQVKSCLNQFFLLIQQL